MNRPCGKTVACRGGAVLNVFAFPSAGRGQLAVMPGPGAGVTVLTHLTADELRAIGDACHEQARRIEHVQAQADVLIRSTASNPNSASADPLAKEAAWAT